MCIIIRDVHPFIGQCLIPLESLIALNSIYPQTQEKSEEKGDDNDMSGKEDPDSEDETSNKNDEKEKEDASAKGSSDEDSDAEKDVPQVSQCNQQKSY